MLALINAAVTAPFSAIGEAVGIAALRGAVLGLLFWGLRAGYRRLRGREGIGLGDVKLAGVAGAWLSLSLRPDRGRDCGARRHCGVLACATTSSASRSISALKFPFGLFFAPAIWIGWLFDTTLLG